MPEVIAPASVDGRRCQPADGVWENSQKPQLNEQEAS